MGRGQCTPKSVCWNLQGWSLTAAQNYYSGMNSYRFYCHRLVTKKLKSIFCTSGIFQSDHYTADVLYLSHLMIKPTKWHVRPAKTQLSLGIRPVWSESSLCAQWVAKDPSFLHADSEDSDQTGRMPRLIWVFAGCTIILMVLSCCGSFLLLLMAS